MGPCGLRAAHVIESAHQAVWLKFLFLPTPCFEVKILFYLGQYTPQIMIFALESKDTCTLMSFFFFLMPASSPQRWSFWFFKPYSAVGWNSLFYFLTLFFFKVFFFPNQYTKNHIPIS